MPNSRSISPETWAKARQRLVFYFSRRHVRSDAEDLAQETLLTIWRREDYEFEKEEDFLKICYGFADYVSKQNYRKARQQGTAISLEVDAPIAAPQHHAGSQRATESGILLTETIKVGKTRLEENEWKTIMQAALALDGRKPANGNVRVRRHRVRKKLAALLGLGKSLDVTSDENKS